MDEVTIIRTGFSDKQTTGSLYYQDHDYAWSCNTLELADKQNQNDISCIPEGEYVCRWTRSNRLSKLKGHDVYTYEVLNVPSRAGIRIHSANYFSQLRGCIALGSGFTDMNKDGELDLLNSRDAVDRLGYIMNWEDFKLIINKLENPTV